MRHIASKETPAASMSLVYVLFVRHPESVLFMWFSSFSMKASMTSEPPRHMQPYQVVHCTNQHWLSIDNETLHDKVHGRIVSNLADAAQLQILSPVGSHPVRRQLLAVATSHMVCQILQFSLKKVKVVAAWQLVTMSLLPLPP